MKAYSNACGCVPGMSCDATVTPSCTAAEEGWGSSGGTVQGKEGGAISNTVTWLCCKAGKHRLLDIRNSQACTVDTKARRSGLVPDPYCSISVAEM